MNRLLSALRLAILPTLILLLWPGMLAARGPVATGDDGAEGPPPFPPALESYHDSPDDSLWTVLRRRVEKEPFNLVASALFLGAILHTFLTSRFLRIAHHLEDRHQERLRAAGEGTENHPKVSTSARVFHFLGEVEAVFGIWVIPLMVLMIFFVGENAAVRYIDEKVNFTEPIFVVVIMTIASTRPILLLAEKTLGLLASLGRGSPSGWWLSILLVGPLLGSVITEPAAMTICASLLSKKIYAKAISKRLAYSTLGLLFVNISVGGVLTNFAAPPVLMVAHAWDWSTPHMFMNFGWKAIVGIAISVTVYYVVFRSELKGLGNAPPAPPEDDDLTPNRDVTPERHYPVPLWVTIGHLAFLGFAIFFSHNPNFLMFGLLFFLAFVNVTEDFQSRFSLRTPVLVGFFLGGLVVHGGLQQWWIAPVLGRLDEVPLMIGATGLTAFNDNAAITYLCSLVPDFTPGMKYAAMAGAVSGGGLTVIANAPNPAGQSILGHHFENGVSPLALVAGAIVPTIIVGLCFMLLR